MDVGECCKHIYTNLANYGAHPVEIEKFPAMVMLDSRKHLWKTGRLLFFLVSWVTAG